MGKDSLRAQMVLFTIRIAIMVKEVAQRDPRRLQKSLEVKNNG